MRKEDIGLISGRRYTDLCLYLHKCFILFHIFSHSDYKDTLYLCIISRNAWNAFLKLNFSAHS